MIGRSSYLVSCGRFDVISPKILVYGTPYHHTSFWSLIADDLRTYAYGRKEIHVVLIHHSYSELTNPSHHVIPQLHTIHPANGYFTPITRILSRLPFALPTRVRPSPLPQICGFPQPSYPYHLNNIARLRSDRRGSGARVLQVRLQSFSPTQLVC